ncbi:MAG: hypothetical protein KDD61_12845 [Bdellovibrionales bacterium]|nr:hypothetical protein [Bdellovibrionales bacterium]
MGEIVADFPLAGHNVDWLHREDIRPYIFVREHNRDKAMVQPKSLGWFPQAPLIFSPMQMDEVHFANQILALENLAFSHSDMAMPRWVFYDCGVMPGFVAGFAQRTKTLAPGVKSILKPSETMEWTPISLFIIIPTMAPREWVAHNLCSINSLLPRENRFYGLGFLSKAFGLWQADIDICCGITQWKSPAIRLHSHYGRFEVLTAFTPVHDYSHTITYRLKVDFNQWMKFFSKEDDIEFLNEHEYAGFEVDPNDESSLIAFQRKIEEKGETYYLNSTELRHNPLDHPLKVYKSLNK